VEKIGQDPTVYCITEAGIAVNLDEAWGWLFIKFLI
jgi:hypothetical protein